MGAAPKITRIVVMHYAHEIENLTLEDMYGFDMVYKEGARLGGGGSILTVETDAGRARGSTRRHRQPHRQTICWAAIRWNAK